MTDTETEALFERYYGATVKVGDGDDAKQGIVFDVCGETIYIRNSDEDFFCLPEKEHVTVIRTFEEGPEPVPSKRRRFKGTRHIKRIKPKKKRKSVSSLGKKKPVPVKRGRRHRSSH